MYCCPGQCYVRNLLLTQLCPSSFDNQFYFMRNICCVKIIDKKMKRYDINYRADCGPAEGRVRSREGWGGRQAVLHQRHRHHQPLLGSCRSPPLLPPWVVAVSSVRLYVTSPIAVLIPLLALLFQPAASTGGGYGAPSTGYGGEDNTETSEVLSSSRPNETTNNLSLGLNEALTSHWVIQSCY